MASQNNEQPVRQESAGSGPRPPRRERGDIFISYRRADTEAYLPHFLYRELSKRFSRNRVFLDIDSIGGGAAFDERIKEVLNTCGVMLAVIGKHWLTVSDGVNRRLDDPKDWVRIEIATALELGIKVIPVLVSGASMPRPDEMPRDLEKLAYRQAVELRGTDWDNDLERLARSISEAATSARFDRYKIIRHLGGGRTGDVYLAEDTLNLGRKVALKKLHPHITQDGELLRQFEQSARAASALDHPNIRHIYDIGEVDSTSYIAFEFVDGQTLRERMKKAPFKPPDAFRIVRRVAQALAAAHDVGIIHRDIQPENIMLRADGYVKVFDFGLAELMGRVALGVDASEGQPSTTNTNGALFDIRDINYMSPEQMRGEPVDARADIWGLGVMLYELISGSLPFQGSTDEEVRLAVLSDQEAPPLATGYEIIDDELNRIVSRALRKNRDKRYHSVKDLASQLQELEELFSAETTDITRPPGRSIPPASPAKPMPPQSVSVARPFRRRAAAVALAAVAIAVAALAYLYYFSDSARGNSVAIYPFTPSLNSKEGSDGKLIPDDIAVNIRNNLLNLKHLKVEEGRPGTPARMRTTLDGTIALDKEVLRVRAELKDTQTGSSMALWDYECPVADWKMLVQQIVADVASSPHLNITLTDDERSRLTRRATFDREAAKRYRNGRVEWHSRTKESLQNAIEHFEVATKLDANFALAWVALADSYHLQPFYDGNVRARDVLGKAEGAIKEALRINPEMGEAYISRAVIGYQYKRDFDKAREDFEKGTSLEPDYAPGWHWYSEFLLVDREHEEAKRKAETAYARDKYSPIVMANLSYVAYFMGDYSQARSKAVDAIERHPDFHRVRVYFGNALEMATEYKAAASEFIKEKELAGQRGEADALREAFAKGGWRGFLKRIEGQQKDKGQPYDLAETYARLAQAEKRSDEKRKYVTQVLDLLDEAFREGSNKFVFINTNPRFGFLCSEARFQALLERVPARKRMCESR